MNYGAHTSRNCTRCGKELTDAASMEAGIGPICRNLDNALLARLIPVNLPAAREHLAKLDLSTSDPVSTDVLMNVEAAVLNDEAAAREDWRSEVKRIEWALSFSGNQHLRTELTAMVAALGYVGLAALWSGDAATGEATVLFKNNLLVVQGAPKAASTAAFRSMKGRWHPKGTLMDKAAWSVQPTRAEEFKLAIITHYPNNTGLAEALAAAAEYLTLNPAVAPVAAPVAAAPAKAACSIENVGVLLKIRIPYDKVKTPAYVNELKTSLTWTDRRWNAVEKCWEVAAIHKEKVVGMITKHFGSDVLAAH